MDIFLIKVSSKMENPSAQETSYHHYAVECHTFPILNLQNKKVGFSCRNAFFIWRLLYSNHGRQTIERTCQAPNIVWRASGVRTYRQSADASLVCEMETPNTRKPHVNNSEKETSCVGNSAIGAGPVEPSVDCMPAKRRPRN
jgi:hypothetical protein